MPAPPSVGIAFSRRLESKLRIGQPFNFQFEDPVEIPAGVNGDGDHCRRGEFFVRDRFVIARVAKSRKEVRLKLGDPQRPRVPGQLAFVDLPRSGSGARSLEGFLSAGCAWYLAQNIYRPKAKFPGIEPQFKG